MVHVLIGMLIETRNELKRKSRLGLFLRPSAVLALIRRFNSMIEMAQELVEESRLPQRPEARPANVVPFRRRRKFHVVTGSNDGGDAA